MKTYKSKFRWGDAPKEWLWALLVFSSIAILLSACAGAETQATPSPQTTPTSTGQSGMPTLTVIRAKSFLANELSVNAETIQLVDAQAVQWPDSCLGVQTPGIMCAMHVVDGFKITLSANDQTYEVRTNLDGSQTMLAPNPVSTQPDKVEVKRNPVSSSLP